ncbi:hypothetical protein [Legionella fairfieldensis]|uniref:hypothetical protein n=1 Tax=Legionella fairfieldensis TaxID=45064 RepID=UPI0004915B7A|nr:hypothetical protein [Legionella fairfieldensis]
MDLAKKLQNLVTVFKNGFIINSNQNISKDFITTIIFCSTFTFLIIGFPYDTFDGLVSWVFKIIYREYLEMDLANQFHYKTLMWLNIKISLIMSISIFLLVGAWITIFYRFNRRTLLLDNAFNLFLFIYRWIFAFQFVAILFVPLLMVKIFDMSYQAIKDGTPINQLPFSMMKKEMISLAIILTLFLLNFLHQSKKLLGFIEAIPKKWFANLTENFAFSAIIPIIMGINFSTSYFYNLMKDNPINTNIFSYNQCIYMKQNPNVPGYNAFKAIAEEIGCKKYTSCSAMTDARLKQNCELELYANSKNFNFLLRNEHRNICDS